MQGSEFLLDPSYPKGDAKQAVLQSCKQHFRPEFLNRLDDMVVFEPLKQVQLREVARLLTEELAERLSARNVAMQVTDQALDYAVKQSYDPLYGARPIRRWLVRFPSSCRLLLALVCNTRRTFANALATFCLFGRALCFIAQAAQSAWWCICPVKVCLINMVLACRRSRS